MILAARMVLRGAAALDRVFGSGDCAVSRDATSTAIRLLVRRHQGWGRQPPRVEAAADLNDESGKAQSKKRRIFCRKKASNIAVGDTLTDCPRTLRRKRLPGRVLETLFRFPKWKGIRGEKGYRFQGHQQIDFHVCSAAIVASLTTAEIAEMRSSIQLQPRDKQMVKLRVTAWTEQSNDPRKWAGPR